MTPGDWWDQALCAQVGTDLHKPPLREDDQGWESSADPGDPATVAAVSHGRQSALAGDRSLESGSLSSRITGRTLAGATAGQVDFPEWEAECNAEWDAIQRAIGDDE